MAMEMQGYINADVSEMGLSVHTDPQINFASPLSPQPALLGPPDTDQDCTYTQLGAPDEPNMYDQVGLKGSTDTGSPYPRYESAKPAERSGKVCSMLWLCSVLALLFTVVVMVCVNIVILLSVSSSSCECDVTKLEQLQQELLTLSGRVNTTEEQLQQELLTLSGRINTTEEQLSPTGIQDILSGGGVSFGATLAGVNPYVNCTTELVRQNTITVPAVPTEPSFGVTETGSVDLDEPGYYTTHAFCARIGSSSEINPFVATLRVLDTGAVSCQCYIVVPDPGQFQSFDVQCGLYMTRCPIQQDIDTTIQT